MNDTDAHEYTVKLLEIATNYATAQAEADRLDGIRKYTFSLLVNEFTGLGSSNAKAEHQARAEDRYKAAMDNYYKANQDAILAKATYEAKKISFEFWRTRQATQRAEMSIR